MGSPYQFGIGDLLGFASIQPQFGNPPSPSSIIEGEGLEGVISLYIGDISMIYTISPKW